MPDEILGGVLGGALGGAYGHPCDGAGLQQANAEAFRRMHESYRARAPPPTPEQAAEAMRGAQNAWPYARTATAVEASNAADRLRASLRRHDWLFWGLLAAMALALAVRYWMQFARSAP